MKKICFFIFYLFSIKAFTAPDLLPLNCLADYKKLTHSIDALDLPSNTKIKLSDLSEYIGPIPSGCSKEFGNDGLFRIVTLRNQILIFELTIKNTGSIFTKYISNTAPIEVGLKRYKMSSGLFKTNLDTSLLLQFTIAKENNGHILETLSYKNIELSQYE
jgi:hypothetical protein